MKNIFTVAAAVALTSVASVLAFSGCGDDTPAGPAGPTGPGGGSSGGGTSGGASSSGASASGSGGVPGPGTSYAGCKVFPNDNAWNTDVSAAPVNTALMTTIFPKMNPTRGLYPDWGTAADDSGIPITVGAGSAPVPITFDTTWGPKESDKLACPTGGGEFCYPIPLNAKIEGGSDAHVLFLAKDGAPDKCVVYELFAASLAGGGFKCGSSALFHLDSNALRKEGDTSADAAGLSIFAGLVRKEEVDRGEITHAMRFTMNHSQNGFIHPATHAAGDVDTTLPPMGLRLRLKATFAEAGFTGAGLTIVKALKKYGVILADNGSDWYITGEQAEGWNMDDLNKQLGKVKGGDFEIVDTGPIIPQPD
jgi:hypothetical protein